MRATLMVTLAFSISSASAEQPPAKTDLPPLDAMPLIRPGEVRVMSLKDFPPEGQPFFSSHMQEGLKSGAEGTRVVPATAGEVDLITTMVEQTSKNADKRAMAVVASDLSKTPVADWEFVGSFADSAIQRPNAPPTRLLRVYKKADREVAITEWNFLADGGGVLKVAEFINATVNGAPAVVVAQRDDTGRALWHLTWATSSKSYVVNIFEPKFDPRTKDFVLAIGRQLVE